MQRLLAIAAIIVIFLGALISLGSASVAAIPEYCSHLSAVQWDGNQTADNDCSASCMSGHVFPQVVLNSSNDKFPASGLNSAVYVPVSFSGPGFKKVIRPRSPNHEVSSLKYPIYAQTMRVRI